MISTLFSVPSPEVPNIFVLFALWTDDFNINDMDFSWVVISISKLWNVYSSSELVFNSLLVYARTIWCLFAHLFHLWRSSSSSLPSPQLCTSELKLSIIQQIVNFTILSVLHSLKTLKFVPAVMWGQSSKPVLTSLIRKLTVDHQLFASCPLIDKWTLSVILRHSSHFNQCLIWNHKVSLKILTLHPQDLFPTLKHHAYTWTSSQIFLHGNHAKPLPQLIQSFTIDSTTASEIPVSLSGL